MGYETQLVIGQEHMMIPGYDEQPTIGEIARVDLSKCGGNTHTGALLSKCQTSDEHYAFYAEDGDTRITEDRYGSKLTAVPLDELVEAMEKDQAEDGEYRRFSLALAMLRQFQDERLWPRGDHFKLRVVQFGH